MARANRSHMTMMAFIRADPAYLNKKAGIKFLPSCHQESKEDDIYCDWMYCTSWTTCKGPINNIFFCVPHSLVQIECCGCPREAKINQSPGQFVLYVYAEHTAEDHKEDKAEYLTYKTRFDSKRYRDGA